MNKAFVKEPEFDGRAYCPRCAALGTPVGTGPLDTYVRSESRAKLHDSAWFCPFSRCDVAYFNDFEMIVEVTELKSPVYPKDLDAPICACFGLNYDDVEADARDSQPSRIRELLAKSQSPDARCPMLSPDGQCCMKSVQELYMKLRHRDQAS